MKRLTVYIRLLIIASLVLVMYACNGSEAGNKKRDSTTVAISNDTAAARYATKDTGTEEQQFRLFFEKFKSAVKANGKTRLIQMFNFPLQTLPQWTNDELKSNPVDIKSGLITMTEFPQYYGDIFTRDALKLIPASKEDDLSEIDKATAENYYLNLKKSTDKGSTLYELEKQYTEDNGKETSFGFVFGKVNGTYKVISYYRPWPLK